MQTHTELPALSRGLTILAWRDRVASLDATTQKTVLVWEGAGRFLFCSAQAMHRLQYESAFRGRPGCWGRGGRLEGVCTYILVEDSGVAAQVLRLGHQVVQFLPSLQEALHSVVLQAKHLVTTWWSDNKGLSWRLTRALCWYECDSSGTWCSFFQEWIRCKMLIISCKGVSLKMIQPLDVLR